MTVISLLWIMVAYSGWNAATYVAEEVKNPERTLPAALAVGTALVAALYLGLNLVFIYSTPLERMKGVLSIGLVTDGTTSLSVMVTLAVVMAPNWNPPSGLLSETVNVSVDSANPSSVMKTLKVLLASPGANVTVPKPIL